MAKRESPKVVGVRKTAYSKSGAAGGSSRVADKGAVYGRSGTKNWRTLDPDEKGLSNAERIMRSMIGDDPGLVAKIEVAQINREIAELIYRAREAAGMTQAQLGAAIGTTQSVISRIEDADYNGHSLRLLRRVAEATGQRLEFRFIPLRRKR